MPADPSPHAAAADIVPPAPLAPRSAEDRRHLGRGASARLLDGHLRRLARQEARGRRVLGTLARHFLRWRGQHALGFARLGDFARERLGLSARELQALARVAECLARLPPVAAAFERGELTWTQVRLLAGVATAETAEDWVAFARGRTVRALEGMITHRTGKPVERDDTIEGEPRVHVRLRCPQRVRQRWHELTVLARCVMGSEVAPWHVADAVGAEGFSARDIVPDDPFAGLPDPPPGPPPVNLWETRAAFGPIDWHAVEEALPEDVEHLTRDVGHLDPFALDRRMRAALGALQRIDWQMGRLLATFYAARLHRLLGFPSAAAYAREQLGISPRKARALVALERKSREAPALAAVYREGELSWLRALSLLPVAAPDTAGAWIERARAVTVRRLVDEVEWAVETRAAGGAAPVAPPTLGARLAVDQRQMRAHEECPPVDSEIVFFAPASVVVMLWAAIAAFSKPHEPAWRGLERLIEHAWEEWQRQPRHRDPIFARDGWRCAAPACSSRRNLHDHHLLFRSRGGGHARQNRITVCAWHHLRGIHQGRVRAWGTAPDDVTWELGVRSGREPLLRLHGDVYVGAG